MFFQGELEQRKAKWQYPHVSKAASSSRMTKIDWRKSHMWNITKRFQEAEGMLPQCTHTHHVSSLEADKLPYTDPKECYHISPSQKQLLDIGRFLREHPQDPALKNFYNHLKDHLLGCMCRIEYDGDQTEFTEGDRDSILICNNRLYCHRTCRLNFTTYDI
ncbi:hypothetical protein JB92DRAFT_3152054 [Gautieria morchelliformis]|nr:hypothetical protein JB92DRAFT_3152054 [Gautieria morchelliformis]